MFVPFTSMLHALPVNPVKESETETFRVRVSVFCFWVRFEYKGRVIVGGVASTVKVLFEELNAQLLELSQARAFQRYFPSGMLFIMKVVNVLFTGVVFVIFATHEPVQFP